MPVTATQTLDVRNAMNVGKLDNTADLNRAIAAGTMASTIKATATGLTSASSFDITTAAFKAASTIVGITLGTNEKLPPARVISTLRVTAGTATGVRSVTDSGGTASTSIAKISDDGKTITFEAAVTAFVITYIPREATALTASYAQSAP